MIVFFQSIFCIVYNFKLLFVRGLTKTILNHVLFQFSQRYSNKRISIANRDVGMISAMVGPESNSDFSSAQRRPHLNFQEVRHAASPKSFGVDSFY